MQLQYKDKRDAGQNPGGNGVSGENRPIAQHPRQFTLRKPDLQKAADAAPSSRFEDAGEVRIERSCEQSQRPLDTVESPSLKMHPSHHLG
jgi:hypothetical protein